MCLEILISILSNGRGQTSVYRMLWKTSFLDDVHVNSPPPTAVHRDRQHKAIEFLLFLKDLPHKCSCMPNSSHSIKWNEAFHIHNVMKWLRKLLLVEHTLWERIMYGSRRASEWLQRFFSSYFSLEKTRNWHQLLKIARKTKAAKYRIWKEDEKCHGRLISF